MRSQEEEKERKRARGETVDGCSLDRGVGTFFTDEEKETAKIEGKGKNTAPGKHRNLESICVCCWESQYVCVAGVEIGQNWISIRVQHLFLKHSDVTIYKIIHCFQMGIFSCFMESVCSLY